MTLSASPLKEPIKVLAEVLQAEMSIPEGRLMLGLENWTIPVERGLYIALFYGPEVVVGNNNYSTGGDATPLVEVQEVAMNHEVVVDAMSFDDEVRLKKEFILMAFASTFCREHTERNGMRINEIPTTFVAVPSLEETKQLNRFRLSFIVNALHRRIKSVPYFDTFTQPEVTHNA